MMYLRLTPADFDDDLIHRPYTSEEIYDDFDCYYYITEEVVCLYDQWVNTPYIDDSFISGLLADYLSDHRSELLLNATGPTDPAVRLDQLIEWLRNRFNSHFNPV